jgi:hypothetical protein
VVAAPLTTTTATAEDAIKSQQDKKKEKKKVKKSRMKEVLFKLVNGDKKMGLTRIMKIHGMSKVDAHRIYKKVRHYKKPLSHTLYLQIKKPEHAVESLEWLREHLADFPFPRMADRFAKNWRADVTESALPGREKACKARKDRANRVWQASMEGFNWKEPMNTLLCVLYTPQSVAGLVRDVNANSNSIAHILVLRLPGVFLVLLTDADPRKRFPLDSVMRIGNYTSAYLWLNLKSGEDQKQFACWESHSKTPTLAVVPAKAVKAKPFVRVSDATVSGMHILALVWMRAWVYAAGAAENGKVRHVHVQPNKAPTTAGGGVVGVDATTAPWVLEVQAFARQFGPVVTAVAKPVVAPPLVRNVFIGPFFDGTINPGTYQTVRLVGNTSVMISTDKCNTARTVTATYEDTGAIAFKTVVSYTEIGTRFPLCHFDDTLDLWWGSNLEQKPLSKNSREPSEDAKPLDNWRGGRVRLQIKDAYRINLLLFQDGMWRVRRTVDTT